jgi:hypothetical protein
MSRKLADDVTAVYRAELVRTGSFVVARQRALTQFGLSADRLDALLRGMRLATASDGRVRDDRA